MTSVTNINDVLDGHVGLDLSCVDRLYLNAYVPKLQVAGQVVTFLTEHLGFPIPSPALLEKIGNRFRCEVKAFAADQQIPILQLKKPDRTRWDDRKLDHVRPYLDAAERAGRTGVVAIVAAQEFAWVFSAKNRSPKPGVVSYDFVKEERRVGTYYFYVLDADFGPGFIKICTYFPYPAKVWLNGHEWAKHQARKQGVAFSELANGFAACADPARLQAICDHFAPHDVQGFFDRWTRVIPTPFTEADRAAGYFFELSMRQVEVSRTIVFDDPRRARGFFEALVADNIGVGRPEEIGAVFVPTNRGARTKMPSQTRVFSPGTEVKMDFTFKHSRVKQYLKEGRALRIETVVNKPSDIGILARLEHLPELIGRARAVNARLLMIERAGQGCAIGSALFERIHQPYVWEGQRTGAFRFGDQRAMALAGSLCLVVHAVTGFTNKSLRGQVAGLLGRDYSSSQMSYDLRRLRLHGLIQRVAGTNTYQLTPEGLRVAIFYTKLRARLLQPLLEADQPPAPIEMRRALSTIERLLGDYVGNARLGVAA
ncbi:MAG: hypothetical protein M0Z46_10965 [Actinomycetota bacterium]|nr:hypothetical protein [Actinomycetota bacterium]MDA8358044.1 hypothetical protein [Actinomycetota bacterium]